VKLETLSLYVDERLSQSEKGPVDAHISSCHACRERFLQLKATKALLRKIPQITESEGFDFEFKRKLDEELGRQESPARVHRDSLKGTLDDLIFAVFRPAPALTKAAALVTLTAFLMVSVFWSQVGVSPAIASVEGQVKIYNAKSGQWQSARRGMKVKENDIIEVGRSSRVNIESKTCRVMLKEDTTAQAVNVEKPFGKTRGISYSLNRGKMLVATTRKFKNRGLAVRSPTAEIKARGTGFMVSVSPAEKARTWVGVLDGRVEVDSRVRTAALPSKVSVEAGKATEVFPDSAPSSPRYLLEDEWKEVQEIYRIGDESQVALLVSMTPRRARELLRPAGLYVSDKKTKAMPRALAGIIRQVNEAIINNDKQKHIDAVYSLEGLIQKYPDPRYNAQFLFFIAGYAYYVDDYQKAISILDRIAGEYPSSRLVSLALCAKGLIYEEDLKDPARAAAAYKAVLDDYPDSLEAEEASAGLTRLNIQ
jgi:hypothetical protein